jgi:hypothetical protein
MACHAARNIKIYQKHNLKIYQILDCGLRKISDNLRQEINKGEPSSLEHMLKFSKTMPKKSSGKNVFVILQIIE